MLRQPSPFNYQIKFIIFSSRDLFTLIIIKGQQQWIEGICTPDDIVKLENDFRAFKNHIKSSESALADLKTV